MPRTPHKPFVSFASPSRLRPYISISVKDETVYTVELLRYDDFYAHLGYTEELKKAGILPDEFIWNQYTTDGCKESAAALQIKLIEYLSKYSITFMEQYGTECKSWISLLLKKQRDV